jgi:hypothetical protein
LRGFSGLAGLASTSFKVLGGILIYKLLIYLYNQFFIFATKK